MKVISGRYSNEEFLQSNGFSRQYVYKLRKSKGKKETMESVIIEKVDRVRRIHRNMGSRVMYHALSIDGIGVNKFEQIISKHGLTVKNRRRRIVTTNGLQENWDKNLINGLTLNGINQVISGDITYFILKNKTYYIFTLKDMYSKRIVGLYGSDNMLAINAVKTLKQVIQLRGKALEKCIHHSDAGSQYKSRIYKSVLSKQKMKMSIAENALQNGMAEQLNGILKHDYLTKEIKNVGDLNRVLSRIKSIINEQRPVKNLGYRTPAGFEDWLLQTDKPPEIKLYDFTQKEKGDFRQGINNKKKLNQLN